MSYIKGHPVNLPRSKHFGSDYVFFYSLKNMREVHAESQLEHAAFIHLEMDKDVIGYDEHPCVGFGDSVFEGSPIYDALVRYADGTCTLVEVKYESDLTGDSKEAVRAKEQILKQQQFAEMVGARHRIIIDKDLFGPPALAANELFMYQRMRTMSRSITGNQARYVIDVLTDGEVHKAEELLGYTGGADTLMNILVLLLYERKIEADIENTPISFRSPVRLIMTEERRL